MRRLPGLEERVIAALALLSASLFTFSIVYLCTQSAAEIGPVVAKLAVGCIAVSVVLAAFAMFMYWINNDFGKGYEYGREYAKLRYSIRQALYDAGYVEADFLGYAYFPKIKISFNDNLSKGIIYIQNSPHFCKPLETFNISSALGDYVVDRWYLSNDQNNYIYEIVDSRILKSLKISSLDEFQRLTKQRDPFTLIVAPETEIRLQHMLICGATRSGKTYLLYVLILQLVMLLNPTTYLFFADPKVSSIWNLGILLKLKHNASDFNDIVAELNSFHDVLIERQRKLAELQKTKLDSDYKDFGLKPYIFIFDEFAAFMGVLQTRPKSERDQVMSILQDIVLKGAGEGCFLWVVMQKSDASSIPTMIRDNLTAKVVLGSAEDTTYTTCFGPGVEIPDRVFKTGEGVYTESGYVNSPKTLCVPTLDFDIAEAMQRAKDEAPVM